MRDQGVKGFGDGFTIFFVFTAGVTLMHQEEDLSPFETLYLVFTLSLYGFYTLLSDAYPSHEDKILVLVFCVFSRFSSLVSSLVIKNSEFEP